MPTARSGLGVQVEADIQIESARRLVIGTAARNPALYTFTRDRLYNDERLFQWFILLFQKTTHVVRQGSLAALLRNPCQRGGKAPDGIRHVSPGSFLGGIGSHQNA
jgi:hypothetical protein